MTAGRPTKLNEETIERLVKAIKVGATYDLACKYAGTSYSSFERWMRRGETATSGIERKLYEAIELAEGAAATAWLAKIEQAASDGQWQAAAWKLERRYPEMYGRRVNDNRNTHSGPDGGPIQIQTYDYAAAAASLAERPGSDRDKPANE